MTRIDISKTRMLTIGLLGLTFVGATALAADPKDDDSRIRHTVKNDARDSHTSLELMRQHGTSLTKAISAAEKHCNGQAVSAHCQTIGAANSPVIEVACVDKANAVQVLWVDMATGNVTLRGDRGSMAMDSDALPTRIVRAEDIIGLNVENVRGESLGEIKDLAIDPQRGQVLYAVLSYGGPMTKDRYYAVPWRAVNSAQAKKYVLDIDRTRLEQAPSFERNTWPHLTDREYARSLHTYYHQRPYWELSDQRSDSDAMLSPVVRASEVLDRKVVNGRDENLGEIEDLAIDPSNGRIAYAVLSFGGFMGVNEKLFAIPWNALSHTNDGKCVLNVDKERLKNAPGFDKKNWPDMANPEFDRSIREYYKSERVIYPTR